MTKLLLQIIQFSEISSNNKVERNNDKSLVSGHSVVQNEFTERGPDDPRDDVHPEEEDPEAARLHLAGRTKPNRIWTSQNRFWTCSGRGDATVLVLFLVLHDQLVRESAPESPLSSGQVQLWLDVGDQEVRFFKPDPRRKPWSRRTDEEK